jgi:anti-sigma28 factor (negative regulator of flagellin synthesis)
LKSQLIATVKIGLWTKEACQLADETDVEERMIKVTYKGRLGTELSELIQNDKAVGQAGRDQRTEVGPTVKSAKVNTYKEAREPQKILRRLAHKDNELFAERVRQIKKLIAKGEYEVDQSMNIDLTELLALHRKRNGGGEKYVGGTWRIKRSPSQRRTSSRLPNKSMQNQA